MAQHDDGAAPDATLLARFVERRDPRAFAEIVRRHGPMVMHAARRVARRREDAEDAFQATFLALAVASGRLRKKNALAAWLHQTAVRTARSIGRANGRWRGKIERAQRGAIDSYVMPPVDDALAVLDEELLRLAPDYRSVIVMCDLEGLSSAHAAGRLGIPVGTVRTRLARGRKLLHARLVRRGVSLAAGAAASLAGAAQATGGASPALIEITTRQALLYADGQAKDAGISVTVVHASQGVIRAMKWTNYKQMTGVALAAALAFGTVGGVAEVFSSAAMGNTIFYDDFNDGSATDGSPRTWTPVIGYHNGTFDASSGDYLIVPATAEDVLITGILDEVLSDTSIRAQVRTSGANDDIALIARGRLVGGTLYQGGINAAGKIFIGFNKPIPPPFPPEGTYVELAAQLTDLRPTTEDVLLQFDVFGNHLSLYAWRPGELRPVQPQLEVIDSQFSEGLVGMIYDVLPDPGPRGSVTFRFYQVADASIPVPEPSSSALAASLAVGLAGWRRSRRLI